MVDGWEKRKKKDGKREGVTEGKWKRKTGRSAELSMDRNRLVNIRGWEKWARRSGLWRK
jgi:hypothetical protein